MFIFTKKNQEVSFWETKKGKLSEDWSGNYEYKVI